MKTDALYLNHILEAIANIEDFVKDIVLEDYLESTEKQFAVERALEIIGEAAKNLSISLKSKYPEVRWQTITGMRNKLIHEYSSLQINIIWQTIKADLPLLKEQIQTILESESPTNG